MGNKMAAAVLVTAALAMTGCSGQTVSAPPQASQAAATTPSAAAKPASTEAAFGGTVTYDKGVSVSVTAAAVPASQYAAGAVEGKIVVVTLKITNGSSEAFNGALMSVPKVTYGADGVAAPTAVDSGHTMALASTINPGETQTATSTYGIPSAAYGTVRVEVTGPNAFSDKPAIFKGAVQ